LTQTLWDATPEWFRPAETELKMIDGLGVPAEIEKRFVPPPPAKTDAE
jgi:hypothetical protein